MTESGLILVATAIVGALLVWGVRAFLKKINARYEQLWSTLAPGIDGRATGNLLTGTHAGMPVQAKISRAGDSGDDIAYFLEIVMQIGKQGKNWTLVWGSDKLIGGEAGWQIKAEPPLREQLRQAGLAAPLEMGKFGYPTLTYRAAKGTLTYKVAAHEIYDVPSSKEWRDQLTMLTQLAQINQHANTVS